MHRLLLGLAALALCPFLSPAVAGEPRTDRYGDPLPDGALQRLGTLRLWHDGEVWSVLFSPDGKTVIATGYTHLTVDGTSIRVWDAETGRLVRAFGAEYGFGSLALAPDGHTLAAEWAGRHARLYDLRSGKQLARLEHVDAERGNLVALAFTPDGKALATVGSESAAQLWDISTAKGLRRFGDKDGAGAIAFTPNGKTVATAGHQGVVLWDATDGKELWRSPGAAAGFHALSFAPDGKTLASGNDEGAIRLWPVPPAGPARVLRGHRGKIGAVAFSPDGKLLASSAEEDIVRLWDVASGKALRALRGHTGSVHCVAFSPDGKTLASGSYDHTVQLWDVATGSARVSLSGHRAFIRDFAVAPDGKTLTTAGEDRTLRVWGLESGKEEGHSASAGGCPRCLVYSPDGRLLAWATDEGKVHLGDPHTGKERFDFPAHDGLLVAMAFSPDGTGLASAGVGGVRLWRARDGRQVWRGPPQVVGEGMPWHLAFSPDGKILASDFSVASRGLLQEGGVRLLDAGTGRAVRRMSRAESDEIHALAFSPDGCTLAVAVAYYSPMPVSLWDPATGREKGRLGEDLLSVFHLAFSPDGRFLAASGQHDAIRIWEVASGKEAYRLHAGEDGVSKIVYAPDGRRLISLGDLTLLVWDATGLADKRRRGALSPEELRSFWDTQAGEDARRAYSAIWCLAALPEQAVAYLGDRLRPVPAIPPKQVERWIADLDDDEFAVREKATAELGKLGEAAVLPLRDGLAKKPSAEAQQRLERLVAAAEVAFASGDRLRELRAAAVLEYVGTPEARRVLVTLAKGAPAARLTREAKASLERLEKKPAGGQP